MRVNDGDLALTDQEFAAKIARECSATRTQNPLDWFVGDWTRGSSDSAQVDILDEGARVVRLQQDHPRGKDMGEFGELVRASDSVDRPRELLGIDLDVECQDLIGSEIRELSEFLIVICTQIVLNDSDDDGAVRACVDEVAPVGEAVLAADANAKPSRLVPQLRKAKLGRHFDIRVLAADA